MLRTETKYYENESMFHGFIPHVMGTRFDMLMIHPNREYLNKLWPVITNELERLERMLNRFDPKSEAAQLKLSSQTPVPVSPEFGTILQLCRSYYEKTFHLFDITLKDFSLIQFHDNRHISTAYPPLSLDFGGFAKGYARLAKLRLKEVTIEFLRSGSSVCRFHCPIQGPQALAIIVAPIFRKASIMPSSFGLWFGAYAESLVDDMLFLQAAFKMCNRNPLGSAAGYGSSFPLNRTMTTRLLGFDSLNYNVVYAQMGRGKMERNVAFALASIAGTVSKLAFDACMFNSQNFGFVKLPDDCTTGSSIMPHKKNPDVFELTRAKCNKLQSLPQQIMMIANNLPSGYFRDLQIIKEVFLPAFRELKDCLQMTTYIMNEIKVNEHILDDDKYLLIFSVEEVNRLVREGMPFRDAYKKVGLDIEAGNFSHDKTVHHTHEGSIGNLCNDEISGLMQKVVDGFNFEVMEQAEKTLLGR